MVKKVLIIGCVATGAKAASRIIRRDPNIQVTVIEQGANISYGACGLPFYIADMIIDPKELMSTPIGVMRDSHFFKNVKGVTVHTKTCAKEIDRENKTVHAVNLETGDHVAFTYDKLVLAVGASPVSPPIEGINLKHIYKLSTIEDAVAIKKKLGALDVNNAVIVGAGLIGMEMVDTFNFWNAKVTVVEMLDTVLPALLDKDISMLFGNYLRSKGVNILTSQTVVRFEGDDEGNVKKVITDKNELEADMVLMSVGVRPNADLAIKAGLKVTQMGAIEVNEFLQTSDPDIYAGGDCVENTHLLTGKKIYAPLGSTANKHGRLIADHITGESTPFPGVLGTGICRVFEYNVGRVGLSEKEASALGIKVETIICPGSDLPHFYPGVESILIKLVADKDSGKLLGAQMVGPGDIAKRLDIMVSSLSFGATAKQLPTLDLAYAPPFSQAMDSIITAANIMVNKLDGLARSVSPLEVKRKIDNNEEFIFLDVRSQQEFEEIYIDHPFVKLIPLGRLRQEACNLPRDTEIITFCKVSLRGYEAQRILDAQGFKDVKFMDGGIAAWPFEKTVNP
jgi:NADPH-dependent 2,4-dienoyl-CoA reductase/sulfur reductase-like enzyme/rhodanese-related sulfurtransferase